MIIIQCDANSQWGMGHLTRCRALGKALHHVGIQVAMVGPSVRLTESNDDLIFTHWHPLQWNDQPMQTASKLLMLAERWNALGFVLDEPRVDDDFQFALYESGYPWLQFDGTAKKSIWAHWVLNALPNASAEKYACVLKNPKTELLLGPKYAILRPEFEAARNIAKKSQPFCILLSFGGGDDRGALAWSLETLSPLLGDGLHIKVISGHANPRNEENLELAKKISGEWIHYAIQPDEPWKIMTECQLAVMASGTTAHEANCCRLPMILMSIAENQHEPGLAWENAHQAHYLGDWSSIDQQTLLQTVKKSIVKVCTEKLHSEPLVDGHGAIRVAQTMQKHLTNIHRAGGIHA